MKQRPFVSVLIWTFLGFLVGLFLFVAWKTATDNQTENDASLDAEAARRGGSAE